MRNFFKGISFTQIGAGALAAVTAFLLSAKIGVAGSVIGVAVGSVVSAVASQMYQNVFKVSTKKIQTVTPFIASDNGRNQEGESGQSAESDSTAAIGVEPSDSVDAEDAKTNEAGYKTGVLPAQEGAKPRIVSSQEARADAGDWHAGELGKSGADSQHSAFSNADQHRRRKIAIIVAVVSALLAVGLTSAIIMLVTEGKGTDNYVHNIVDSSKVDKTPAPSVSTGTGQTPSPSSDSADGSTPGSGESGSSADKTAKPDKGTTNDGNDTTGGSGSSDGSTSSGSEGTSGTGSTGSDSDSGSNGNGSNGSGTTGGSNSTSGSNGGSNSGSTGSNGAGTSGGTTGSGTSGSNKSGSTTGSGAKGSNTGASDADSSARTQELIPDSSR